MPATRRWWCALGSNTSINLSCSFSDKDPRLDSVTSGKDIKFVGQVEDISATEIRILVCEVVTK